VRKKRPTNPTVFLTTEDEVMFSLTVSPNAGPVGTAVTLVARGIGESATNRNYTTAVFTNNIPAPFVITSINTAVIVITPALADQAAASSGVLRVNVMLALRCPPQEFLVSADFTVTTQPIVPVIESISGSFDVGSTLVIAGKNLTPFDTVTVRDIEVPATQNSNGTINFTLPATLSGANLPVIVNTLNNGFSNPFPITINPVILDVNGDNIVFLGQESVLTGQGIASTDIVTVSFNGVAVDSSLVQVSDGQVIFTTPFTLTPGNTTNATITIGGATSAPLIVTVGSISIDVFPIDNTIVTPTAFVDVILGGSLQGNIIGVTIGGQPSTVTSATNSSASVIVNPNTPIGAGQIIQVTDGTTTVMGTVSVDVPTVESTNVPIPGSTFVISGIGFAQAPTVRFDSILYTGTIDYIDSGRLELPNFSPPTPIPTTLTVTNGVTGTSLPYSLLSLTITQKSLSSPSPEVVAATTIVKAGQRIMAQGTGNSLASVTRAQLQTPSMSVTSKIRMLYNLKYDPSADTLTAYVPLNVEPGSYQLALKTTDVVDNTATISIVIVKT
jgi:hypothetical protein